MDVISKLIVEIRIYTNEQNATYQQYLDTIHPKIASPKSIKKRTKITRGLLKFQKYWLDWEAAEHKQLQQYTDQGMFSDPQPISEGENSLPFI